MTVINWNLLLTVNKPGTLTLASSGAAGTVALGVGI